MRRLIRVPVCTLALAFFAAQCSIAQDQNVPRARPAAASTPHLPDDPYLGANSGKPDLGGNSQSINSKMRGIWRVPYIIDMQKQGCALGDQKCYESLGKQHTTPVEVPFTEVGRKAFEAAQATNSKEDPEGFCLPPGVPRMMYTPYPTEILQLRLLLLPYTKAELMFGATFGWMAGNSLRILIPPISGTRRASGMGIRSWSTLWVLTTEHGWTPPDMVMVKSCT